MKFEELEILGFGRLKPGMKIPFSSRLNVILAPNDKGKSTLQQALFAFLYPFGDSKTDNGRKLRARYRPWRGDNYGGAVVFSLDSGKKFRLEKIIGDSPREDKIGVFESCNGYWKPVKIKTQDRHLGLLTGRHFLGIGREAFEGLSIVKQFDVASLGEKGKILDELRAIIEMGKTGQGLTSAIKKLEDKKSKIGMPDKRGRRTIAGNKQIRLDEINHEIHNLEEQLKKVKQLFLEQKKIQDNLNREKRKLQEVILPKIELLTQTLGAGLSVLKTELNSIPQELRNLSFKDIQNLRNYYNFLQEIIIRLEAKDENISKILRSLKTNFYLTIFFSLSAVLFLFLSFLFTISQGGMIFLSLFLFLITGIIALVVIHHREKKSLSKEMRYRHNLIQDFVTYSKELKIIENVAENVEDIGIYLKLWEDLLSELGVKDIGQLEEKWQRSCQLTEILNKAEKFNMPIRETTSIQDIDLKEIEEELETYSSLVAERKICEEKIQSLQSQLDSYESTITNYAIDNDLAVLYFQKEILEEDLHKLSIYRQALELSIEFLKQAGKTLYAQISPYLNQFVNRYFKHLSQEYEFVEITPDLELRVKPLGLTNVVDVDNLGKGMQTSLYLFLRLAIISLFVQTRGESLPFILDETFNVLDDFCENRQRKFLELLLEVSKDYNIQWIYFTCQKHGQYLPIKKFLQEKGYIIKEQGIEDFLILQGDEYESELSG